METISLKMDKHLLQQIDRNLKINNYSTRTEFIRDSIRSKLTELEKHEAIRNLELFKGSLKGKAKISYEQAKKEAAKELFLSRRWDLKDLD